MTEGDVPLLDLPDVRQRRGHDCGRAALKAVVQYLGCDPGLVLQRLPATTTDGVDPRTMESALRVAGFSVLGGTMEIADLRHAALLSRPVLCVVTIDWSGHWVVSRGVSRGQVHYQDPAAGRSSMTLDAWRRAWEDHDRFGVYARFGLQVW